MCCFINNLPHMSMFYWYWFISNHISNWIISSTNLQSTNIEYFFCIKAFILNFGWYNNCDCDFIYEFEKDRVDLISKWVSYPQRKPKIIKCNVQSSITLGFQTVNIQSYRSCNDPPVPLLTSISLLLITISH